MAMLVNIEVEDLDTAIQFYQNAVGLKFQRRLFDSTVAEMGGVSSLVYLVQKRRDSSPSRDTDQVRDYRRHWTPVHLDFVVPELQPAVDRAVRAGAKIEGGVQVFSWGRMATMSDPFGNGLCLVQWTDGGYDAVS